MRRNSRSHGAANWEARSRMNWIALRAQRRAAPALQDDWFFCAQCQTAKPRSSLSYFAGTAAKCVTPGLRAARKRTTVTIDRERPIRISFSSTPTTPCAFGTVRLW